MSSSLRSGARPGPGPGPKPGVVVITGASSGIGLASAELFAREGWHVIGTGRDPDRSAAAEALLREVAAPAARIDFLRADMCEMARVRQLAGEIANLTDRVDVLLNNAGGVRDAIYTTGEGLEATFAANHLAPFLLTRELMPLLRAAASDAGEFAGGDETAGAVRVIAVSSSAHAYCPGMNWDDLMFRNGPAGAAYCQAKLANLLFTRALARRLAGTGIVAQAMHPGLVHSNFASHGGKDMQDHFARSEGLTPQDAARTIFWLATAPEGGRAGGRYFHDMAEEEPAPQALDDAAAERLWTESERLLASTGNGPQGL